jgi:hypothetical protein
MIERQRSRGAARAGPAGCILELDVGHSGLSAQGAVETVAAAITRVRCDSRLRILKVIHGRGSGRDGGVIRREVRSWLHGSAPVRAVIEGEHYEIFDPDTQEMRAACGQHHDPDLGRHNSGITVVWVS